MRVDRLEPGGVNQRSCGCESAMEWFLAREWDWLAYVAGGSLLVVKGVGCKRCGSARH